MFRRVYYIFGESCFMMRIPKAVFIILIIYAALMSVAVSVLGVLLVTNAVDSGNSGTKESVSQSAEQSYLKLVLSPYGDYSPSDDELDAAKDIIKSRAEAMGVEDIKVTDLNGDIVIKSSPADGSNPLKTRENVEALAQSSVLTFRLGKEFQDTIIDNNGNTVQKTPVGETESTVLMDGSDVKSAEAKYGQMNSGSPAMHYIVLEFTDEGTKRFAEVTRKYKGQAISIWMDDIMISAPTVNDEITDGKAIISGDFTEQTAKELADNINFGALPYPLEITDLSVIN